MTPTDRTYAGRVIAERKNERRQRLIEAAVQRFAERGYANSAVADICTDAGLSKRQFYEEFRTREDILIAVYDLIQKENLAALQAAAAAAQPAAGLHQTVVEIMRIYLDSLTTDRRRAAVVFVVVMGVSDRVERHRRLARHEWAHALESILPNTIGTHVAIKGGALLASATIIGALNGLLQEWLLTETHCSTNELANILASVVLSLIQE